ncbi:hypothetical protein ASPZODRAFT_93924 [Penicilliopsis zonata CBS 506.65]|uniref:DUF647 domain-containing protein n=1 Tax=Penicilliopsis zonata CBS 506.65 TaxID=1073090 RepID=A0A1L9SK51_9EURO|nr:hypothetical protein ASPZODRAFT_93924 [Penicilliopsis zonata CBS 506.65]OJJ47471.1 hypothetical protein ASPZODRAFT_93924 [Penicilliopsis zonata CBS 506.65]
MASTGNHSPARHLVFTETDEVDNATATYIYSQSKPTSDAANQGRVDISFPSTVTPSSWSTRSLLNYLIDVFLPAGYPHSVTDDYLQYQIFDSLQAFCSSIAGLLSSRAVLQGVGVGNASASPTSALLLHILQDSSGRIATILFAHRVGTALEPECKMYRLAADVFNDLAMILDCLSPLIPAGVSRVSVLSAAGVLRALCGVAGGSSKASLSAHFAKWGNLAEVNAKDSSQETIISLVGMLVGSIVVSRVTSFAATWISLILLLILHLSMNYAAVRAVHMTSLNRQRANIVFSTMLASDPDLRLDGKGLVKLKETSQSQKLNLWTTLSPKETASRERIFERDGVLRWTAGPSAQGTSTRLGSCRIGVSLHDLLQDVSSRTTSGSLRTVFPLTRLTSLFSSELYILFLTYGRGSDIRATIVLKKDCTGKYQLKAWAHALLAARVLSSSLSSENSTSNEETETILCILSETLAFLNDGSRFERFINALSDVGWNMSTSALETRPGRRVQIGS